MLAPVDSPATATRERSTGCSRHTWSIALMIRATSPWARPEAVSNQSSSPGHWPGLVFGSALMAVALGVPLGIGAHRHARLGVLVLGAVGLLQTVPSLALLAFLIALLGSIGFVPALLALFLYALLPIARNTQTGLAGVPDGLRDAARALGLRDAAMLLAVELPLALPTLLAGVTTAAVINVGTATVAAFVGAGGLGERIVAGLAVNDTDRMLAGAIPARPARAAGPGRVRTCAAPSGAGAAACGSPYTACLSRSRTAGPPAVMALRRVLNRPELTRIERLQDVHQLRHLGRQLTRQVAERAALRREFARRRAHAARRPRRPPAPAARRARPARRSGRPARRPSPTWPGRRCRRRAAMRCPAASRSRCVAPFSATTAFQRAAASRHVRSASANTSSLSGAGQLGHLAGMRRQQHRLIEAPQQRSPRSSPAHPAPPPRRRSAAAMPARSASSCPRPACPGRPAPHCVSAQHGCQRLDAFGQQAAARRFVQCDHARLGQRQREALRDAVPPVATVSLPAPARSAASPRAAPRPASRGYRR